MELHAFLRPELADVLEKGLRARDIKDSVTSVERGGKVLPHSTGLEEDGRWIVKGPPHKARYCVLKENSAPIVSANLSHDTLLKPNGTPASMESLLASLQSILFPSPAFRTWITIVCALIPISYAVEARRFRPGLDYTLAKGDDKEDFRLDVVLGLTPTPTPTSDSDMDVDGKGKGKASESTINRKDKSGEDRGEGEDEDEDEKLNEWESGEWGGWEVSTIP